MRLVQAPLVADRVLRDALLVQAGASEGGLVADLQVAAHDGLGHLNALVCVGVAGKVVPPVAAEHDGDFGAGSRVLAGEGVRVEDDAEGALGVLREGDGARDEVAEAVDGEDVGVGEVEVDDHDGYGVGAGERIEQALGGYSRKLG